MKARLVATCVMVVLAPEWCHAQLQDPLNPAGPQARHIERAWWLYFWVSVVVYVLVMGVVLAVAWRSRRRATDTATARPTDDSPVLVPDPTREHRLVNVVSTSVVVTVVLLFVLLIGDFVSGRAVHSMTNASDSMTIKVTGHTTLRFPLLPLLMSLPHVP